MRFGQATQIDRIDESESDESAAASDAKVGTPKQEMVEVAAAEEDAATVEQAIATVGQAIAIAAAEQRCCHCGTGDCQCIGQRREPGHGHPNDPNELGASSRFSTRRR